MFLEWSSVRVIAGLPAEGVARGFAIKDHKLVADSAVNAAIEGFEGWLGKLFAFFFLFMTQG